MGLTVYPARAATYAATLPSGWAGTAVTVSKSDGKYWANGQQVPEKLIREFISDLETLLAV